MIPPLRRINDTQEESCPCGFGIHIIDTNTKTIQQTDEALNPNLPETMETNEPNGSYNESSQPRGRKIQVRKIDEVLCAHNERCVRLMLITFGRPGVEEIRNDIVLLAPKHDINHGFVVFCMVEAWLHPLLFGILMAETNLK